MQVGIDDRRLQLFGELHGLCDAVRHDHAAAGHDHRKFGGGQQIGRFIEALVGAGAAQDFLRGSEFRNRPRRRNCRAEC